ncbi:MAG: AMP-binding protein [Pseudomonadota bacterium]
MTPYLTHHLLWNGQPDDKVALIQNDTQVDYAAFRRKTAALAGMLQSKGLKPGDRCAIYLPKELSECWSIFAASAAGGVFVPINLLLKAPQVRHIIEDCNARILITTQAKFATIAEELGDLGGCDLLFLDDLDLDQEVARPADVQLGEDLGAIMYTSGSTGRPKGVMISHRNLLAGSRIVSEYLSITSEDRLAAVLPFSFDYGLNQLISSVEQAASLVLVSFRFGEDIIKAVRKHEITGLAGVPTVWAILIGSAPSLKESPPPSLRYITNSGGAVPTKTVEQLRKLLPDTEIFLMYGLTEAFRSTFLPPDQLSIRPNSIGKAIPECEMMVVKDNGELAQPGETGILVHRGPTVSMGYWKRPDATAKVIRPNPLKEDHTGVDLVCYSGDLVRIDEEGYLYFVGRNDAMIKSSGYRISPSDVEEALMATGHFAQAAVIGIPDDTIGKRVHAIVTTKDGNDVDTRAVLKQLGQDLPNYMVPRQIEILEALPKTPNGKVNVKLLTAERS